MENSITWLLVADSSKAKIYAMHKLKIFKDQHDLKNLTLIGEYTHDASRKKKSELTTDRMGEFGSGSFIEATSPKFREAEQFANELLGHIQKGHQEKLFRDLIIVAPPTFIGILNKQMSTELNKLISQKIEKDYTQYSKQELLANLLQHFL